ncbi:MAG: DUF1570 domain-containing protein [Candidatus Omnitrophota bacterium]
MKWYREGSFTLITDSYATWVTQYRKTIRQLGTDFYLAFFPLLKDREATVEHYIVVFDDWPDFIEYAATDGVPGWVVAGYFSPKTEILVLFNMLGDRFASLIEEVCLQLPGQAMDQAVASVESQVDQRRHVFIEGKAHDVMKKFSALHSVMRGMYREKTVETLRHELTHALFHNYSLQTVVVSNVKGYDPKEAEQKRSFLEEKDIQKKRELLLELLQMKESQAKPLQMEASNSWFVEGLATYMEAAPLGATNKRWLYAYQKARKENALFPVEHLTVYKMGSFPGIALYAMESAYAQSWAFVYFLIDRYPDAFMKYLERISRETPKENEDILWLLGALGKDLRGLDAEYQDYMKQFPELEDPYLEEFDMIRSIFQGV